jgi:pimeloyl-ACP methyl ester carboxylesterase
MQHALTVAAEILGVGAVVTFIGAWLIERAHPPRGRFIDNGGLRQHVVELGASKNSPPIVLIHGAGCNLEDMRLALGDRLAARHRVILIDRAGMGYSQRKSRRGSSPVYQAAVLRGLLDRLGVERAVVVGHSWGGTLALSFALDHPERAAGLVLLAPPLYPFNRSMTRLYTLFATPVAGWLYAHTLALPLGLPFIGMAMGSAFLPQLPPRSYIKRSAALLLLRPAVFLANARDVADLRGNLATQAAGYGALTVPTVIVTGRRDMVVAPRRHAVAFAAAVPGAKLVVLPGMGHMLHHVAAERVVAEIEELAARYSAALSSPT